MGPKVKLIYLCHPSNPTGAILSERELKEICRIAGRHGAYVVSDEIYRGLEWEGGLSPSVVNLYERGVSHEQCLEDAGDERLAPRLAGDPGPAASWKTAWTSSTTSASTSRAGWTR